MPLSSLAFVVVVLSASPGDAVPVQTVQDSQRRTVWVPLDGGSVDVFAGRAPDFVSIEVPDAIKELKADPALFVDPVVDQKHEKRFFFWLGLREGTSPHSGLTVKVVLVDGTEFSLRAVMRPTVKDAAVRIIKRPRVDPKEAAHRASERLSRCRSGEEMIADKTKLIAERGSEAVINRVFGDAFVFKQTNGLSLTVVEVVHDVGVSYATLVITNQSQYDWPVDLEQIKLSEAGVVRRDVNIIARTSQREVIPPKRQSRIVLAYETPASESLVVSMERSSLYVVMAP